MTDITISAIFDELNANNSTNYKKDVLEKYKEHSLLQKVLKMTYDHVEFTYGMSLKNIEKFTPTPEVLPQDLEFALNILETNIASGEYTGHAALQMCSDLLDSLSDGDADVLRKIINRDIRCGVGRTQMNKVWPGLITKQVYMRCDVYGDKTSKKVKIPAYIQLKADGTFREFTVNAGEVAAKSRSGESYEYPVHFKAMSSYPDGVYTGELTVRCNDEIIEEVKERLAEAIKKGKPTEAYEEVISTYTKKKSLGEEYILPRAIGNGFCNSSNPPHSQLVYDVWDFITLEDYKLAANLKNVKNECSDEIKAIKQEFADGVTNKQQFNSLIKTAKKNHLKKMQDATPKVKYETRFANLIETVDIYNKSENVRTIPYKLVNTLQEALEITSEWMNLDFEGGVLKNLDGIFKDGTSSDQLKLKLCIDAEVRIIGFADGRVGTKREGKVGAVIFENDERTIRGRTSGFSDELMDDMTNNPGKYMNRIMTVQFNDLSMASGNDYWSLSHPRFIEMRDDKDETDTLKKVFALREMAMCLGAE